MEEYMEGSGVEQELPQTGITETVSGNSTGTNDMTESEAPLPEETEQGELLERLDALVEALTPEEEPEEESETDMEVLPSETETAVLELLERIYAETAAGRSADSLYYEAWTEWKAEEQKNKEVSEKMDVYTITVLLGVLFLCACTAGIQVAGMIWERFK
ncbi:MAG: hypothetical protein HFI51_04445 [Lachnospiraceae bacterium]|nr:hypothetical protein [Lachnospiraceae bacterium]